MDIKFFIFEDEGDRAPELELELEPEVYQSSGEVCHSWSSAFAAGPGEIAGPEEAAVC